MTDENLTTIQALFKRKYDYYLLEDHQLQIKIGQRERQLERLKKRKGELDQTLPSWIDTLIRPILEVVQSDLPGWKYDDKSLVPQGLSHRVPIFFDRMPLLEKFDAYAPENCLHIVFRPGNLFMSELFYETGEIMDTYKTGSLGDMNGMNNKTKQLTCIDEVVRFLKAQIINHETM